MANVFGLGSPTSSGPIDFSKMFNNLGYDNSGNVVGGVEGTSNIPTSSATPTATGGFGMNMDTALGGAQALTGLGTLALGFKNYEQQKKAFDFNKMLQSSKFNADATQYNAGIDRYNAINQDITERRKGLGDVVRRTLIKKELQKYKD